MPQAMAPLHLRLSPSFFIALFVLLVHLSAFLALLSVVDLLFLLPLILLLVVSLIFYRRRLVCYRGLSCLHEQQWSLTDRNGQRQSVRLTGGVMLGSLILLSFVTEAGKRISLFLSVDSMDAVSLRRLRTRLTLLRASL